MRKMIECACGCGNLRPERDYKNQPRQFLLGHSGHKYQKGRIAATGEQHYAWKGGIVKHQRGYLRVYKPDHPNHDGNNRVFQHRLVMEKHLGRYLTKEELVHHINGNKQDNRIDNLQLVTQEEHTRLHKEQTQLRRRNLNHSEIGKRSWITRRRNMERDA